MFFYAVDTSSGGLVPRQDVIERIEERASDIEALFKLFEVEEVKSVVVEKVVAGLSITAAEAALIVIGILIVIGGIIGAVCICVSWKKKEDERKRNEVNAMFSNGLKPYSLANPVFTDCDGYSDPIDLDKVSLYEGCKPMETQNLSMYIPDESETSSSASMHAKMSTFGHRGATILVVDGSDENTMVKTDGRYDGNSWASPYTAEAAMPSRGTSQSSGYTSSDLELSSPCGSARDDTRPNIPTRNPSGNRGIRGERAGNTQSTQRHRESRGEQQQRGLHKSPKSEREAIEALQKLIQEAGTSESCAIRLKEMTAAEKDLYSVSAKYQTRLPSHEEARPDGHPPLVPVRQSRRRLFPPQIHPPPLASEILVADQDPIDLPGTAQPLLEPKPTKKILASSKGKDGPMDHQSPASSPDSTAAEEGDKKQLLVGRGHLSLEEDDEDPTYAKVVFPSRLLIANTNDKRASKTSSESLYDVPKISYAKVTKDLPSKHKPSSSSSGEYPLYRTVIEIDTADQTINSSVVRAKGRRGSRVSPLPSSTDSSPTNSAEKRKALAVPLPPGAQTTHKALGSIDACPGKFIPTDMGKANEQKSVTFKTSEFAVGYTAL